MPFYILKRIVIVLIPLCLFGCASAEDAAAPVREFVSTPFEARANAEFSELSAEIRISCAPPDGIKMEFTAPESIAGLSLTLSGDVIKTSFAGAECEEKLSETDESSPVKALSALMNELRRECASEGGIQLEETKSGLRFSGERGSALFFEGAPRELLLADAALRLEFAEFRCAVPGVD